MEKETSLEREIQISRALFEDVDHFSEWETDLGWDIESLQLSSGSNEILFDYFAFPDLLVSHFSVRQSMQNIFALPDGMILLTICRRKAPVFWCGRHVPTNLMAVVRPGREHWVVLPEAWDAYEFTISEDLIRRTELFPTRFQEEAAPLERACVPLVEPVTARFLRRLDSWFRRAHDSNGSPGGGVHRALLFDSIMDGLQQVIDAGLEARNGHRLRTSRRTDLVAKGRDFVSANLGADISADDMAQELGVSYRVLNYSFRDSLGLSPYRYILTAKLHEARRRLQRSDVSVTEACFSLGFYTPSRFTRQFTRLFGELPSAVKRRNGVQSSC
jgi:AraC-like DNA-binding protein